MGHRLTNIKQTLFEHQLDALLISSVPNIIYLTNFAYFSTEERDAYVLITKNSNYIITSPLYSHAVKQNVRNMQLLEMTREHRLEQLLADVAEKERVNTVGIEANNLTVHEYQKFSRIFKSLKPADLSRLRMIKDAQELLVLEKACKIGDQAFAKVQNEIQEGMTEKELALALEWLIRKQNADLSFRTIVAFGENAAVPHHMPQERKLQRGDVVLLDFGVKYENYCSDMTRTLVFGKAREKIKQVYETVLTAQQKAVEYISSRLRSNDKILLAKETDAVARAYIKGKGWPALPHSLGHGIGLEVHEAPSLSPSAPYQLKEGMVFSIEPGIYLPEEFGVRIEDLYVWGNEGLQQLTNAPKGLVECN
jgi:Xaa-Pro aminopeptidase